MGVVGCVGQDEVDDNAGGGVDRNPGYRVLAWESCGDFTKVFGACNNLSFGMLTSVRCER